MANGEPISSGRISGSKLESSEAISRASGLEGETISPSIAAMSRPRPKEWLETEPPAVSVGWSEHMHETVILCSWLSLVSTRDDPRVDLAGLDVGHADVVEDDVLVLQQRQPLGRGLAARALLAQRGRIDILRAHRPRRRRRIRHRRRRSDGRGRGGGRGRGVGRVLEQAVGLVEAELVAAAELLGGAFDVGDPFAELARGR